MSISKTIKQVLSILKQLTLLLGNKCYKSYPVTNIKVTPYMRQVFEGLFGDKPFNLNDFDVIGKFSEDKTEFEGFCITYAIPRGVPELFPDGLLIEIPLPLVDSSGVDVCKFEVNALNLTMLYAEKENPFDWGGACEVFYGKISTSYMFQLMGGDDIQFENKPNFSCELKVQDNIDRNPSFALPQVSFNGDSNNNIGHSVVIMRGEQFILAHPEYKENVSGMGVDGVNCYTLEVEQGDAVIVLDIFLKDITNLFAVAGADLEYYKKWMVKHQISFCTFYGYGMASISKFQGNKGILNLGIGILAPQTSPANE